MDTDNEDVVVTPPEPIQLVPGNNGKPVVPVVTVKTVAVMPDGRPCWIYPDGAVRGERGRLLVFPPYEGIVPITVDNSLDMHKRRREQGVELAIAGMGMAAADLGLDVSEPAEMWSHIVRAQSHLAQDIRKGRGSTEAARLVGRASKLLPDRQAAEAEQPAPSHSVDVDALIRLAQAFDREAQRRAELIAADMVAVDGVVVGDSNE